MPLPTKPYVHRPFSPHIRPQDSRTCRTQSVGDIAQVQYTSGTTGRAKGAALTHRVVVHTSAHVTRCARRGPAPGEAHVHSMPPVPRRRIGRRDCNPLRTRVWRLPNCDWNIAPTALGRALSGAAGPQPSLEVDTDGSTPGTQLRNRHDFAQRFAAKPHRIPTHRRRRDQHTCFIDRHGCSPRMIDREAPLY
jgi:hypothetical protein